MSPHVPTRIPGSMKHLASHPGQDKERHIEEEKHHDLDPIHPGHIHHPQVRPALPPRHDTHTHPHGDELPAHTNPPGPIKPSKKLTRTGKT
jgi:hypothetical protein